MKLIVLFIGVMLVKGMQLHRHINRHGHKRQRTDPQRETNELGEIDKAADKQKLVDGTVIQRDFSEDKLRSNPGNVNENTAAVDEYSTNVVQNKLCDENVMPKPGLRKNKLVAKYGTNFRYMGIVKNGLDRVTVVTSMPIPRFENIQVKPINFVKCAKTLDNDDKNKRYLIMADTEASKAAKEWCAWTIPYIEYLKQQEKYYIDKVHERLCEDLYSALPELKLMLGPLRKRRGIGTLILSLIPGLITLAVESVSSWIKGKQQRRVDEAVSTMRAESQVNRNKLRQYSNDFLMYGKYNVDTPQNVIDTVNAMHRRQTELEKQASGRATFGDTDTLVESMKFGFDLQMYMKVSDDEHVKQLQVLEHSSKDVIRDITVLSQGRLPQEFFSDSRLKKTLSEVQEMVQKGHPNYALAAEHISHYRDMKLVTFAVNQQTHSLIVTFPVFIQDY